MSSIVGRMASQNDFQFEQDHSGSKSKRNSQRNSQNSQDSQNCFSGSREKLARKQLKRSNDKSETNETISTETHEEGKARRTGKTRREAEEPEDQVEDPSNFTRKNSEDEEDEDSRDFGLKPGQKLDSDLENKEKNNENFEEREMEKDQKYPVIDAPPPETFIVEKILDKKKVNGQLFYFVKWEGYSEQDNTWEPAQNLLGCNSLIDEFEEHQMLEAKPKKRGRKPKSQKTEIIEEYVPVENGNEDISSDSQKEKGRRFRRLLDAFVSDECESGRESKKQVKKGQRKTLRKLRHLGVNKKEDISDQEERVTADPKVTLDAYYKVKDKQRQPNGGPNYVPVKITNHKCIAPLEGNLKERLIFQVEWVQQGEEGEGRKIVSFETRDKVKREFAYLLVDYYEDFLHFSVNTNK